MKKTIFFGGQERPVNYGTLFLFNFQEKHGVNPLAALNEALQKLPASSKSDEEAGSAFLAAFPFPFMVNVLICALESGAEMDGVADSFDRATVCEWVDEEGGMEFLGSVMGMMFEALPKGKPEQKRSAGGATVPSKKKK